MPNLIKSSGVTPDNSVSFLLFFISAPNPILVPVVLLLIISFSPTNAPPAMNKISLVLISIISPPGCLRPPAAGILQVVPSTNLSSAC